MKTRKINSTGRAVSIPVGLAYGALWSLIITILGSMIIAKLVSEEIVEEAKIGYCVMVMLVSGAYSGAMCAKIKIKRRKLMVCILSSITYMLMLLMTTILFFGGQFSSILETSLLVICGAALAALTGTGKKRAYKIRKIKGVSC